MEKKTRGNIFTGGTGEIFDRVDYDFYATAPETTRALLDVFELKGSIYECACGMGHISKILEEYYPHSEIISTDLMDRGYGESGIDFLKHNYNRKFDNIITNPPFKYAKEFVKRGLELSNDKVIMLLKIQFLESKSRKEFLQSSPLKYIYVFSERQNNMRSGLELNPETNKKWSGTMMFGWFVWEQGYNGLPMVQWL